MSTTFNFILPGAWQLIQDVKYEIFSLQVPVAWQQVAKSLATKRANKGHCKYPSIPVSSLDPIIAASFPQTIKTQRGGWQRPGVPWLFATETPDLSDLPEFIKDWLREEFYWCLGENEVNSALDNLNNDDWHWNEEPITNLVWQQPQSQYEIDFRFSVLPDYLAGEFLKKREVSFGQNNQYQLAFYRVVSLERAELMSWPPHPVPLIKRNEQVGTAHISFVIRFKLQTVPWRDEPMIYHQLSIRRWLTEPLKQLPYRGSTAYIGDNRRWLDGSNQPFCLIHVAMKQLGKPAKWPRAISELLKINDSPLPDPDALAKEPKYNWSAFSADPTGIQAAIAYDSRHYGEQPCLPGVSPLDLASLDQAIQEHLPLCRVGEAERVEVKRKDFWELTGKPTTPILRPEIAAPATFRSPENSPHTILILWETRECRNALIDTILKLLSLSPSGETKTYVTPTGVQGEETIYEGDRGFVRIKTQHVQDLTQRLDVDNPAVQGNSRQQKRLHLMDERIRQIASSLPRPEGLSGALIEIKQKKSFFPPESDPKLALRIGAMQAGYVNQHLHALTRRTNPDENRLQRAVTDLLRQFGILPAPLIRSEKDGINPHLWLTCFYVLRRTRKTTANNKASTVALMVRVNPVTGIVQVTTPSLFPTWKSYPDALGYLITEKWDVDSYANETTGDVSDEQQSSEIKREQQMLNKFVSDCLRDCLSTPIEQEKNPRVLFMAEAQNARKMLTWLQNPQLPANDLPKALALTESQKNRLWVVRLRVAENGEVPIGIVKDSPGSRSNIGGVFRWQNVCDDGKVALYLSLRKSLTTEQDILRQYQSRLDNGSKQAGNPKFLEIALVYHPGIEPDKLACFIHHLRRRWPYFADDVSLPFPFPFATLAKEYAVSAFDAVEDSEESDESEESED